jgi:pimeloyl-ACP methyl ester carboxylesterase
MLSSTQVSPSAAQISSAIPSFDMGGGGPPLHFLHANGYPPACYTPLLQRLVTQFHVFGMFLRPLWPGTSPNELRDWKPFSEDLRQFLGSRPDAPVIGVGHSIGAVVTLRAALRAPRLFRALILIDPVLLPPLRILQLRVLHMLHIRHGSSQMVEGALRRRRRFDDRAKMFAGYRHRKIFRFFSDENLRALIEGLTHETADGHYELTYSPEWEARIYETAIWNDGDLWSGIPSLRTPTLFLRGAQTDTFFARTADMIRQRNPRISVATVPDATHLVPLERPDEVVVAIQGFLASLSTDKQIFASNER